jgi:hypothetical protein
MMSFANRRRFAGSAQALRDRIAAFSPNGKTTFALKMLDNFLAKQNRSQPAATTAEPAAGGAAGGMGSAPLSPNDPRSLTDPRTRSNVSKTLLGQ